MKAPKIPPKAPMPLPPAPPPRRLVGAEHREEDAADALAVAITHAHHRGSATLRLKVVGI